MATGLQSPLPLQPLIDFWERRHQAHLTSNCTCTQGGVCGSLEMLADAIKVSRTTLHRKKAAGTITMVEADQWAKRLGQNASRIWPEFDRAPVTAALSDCGGRRWTGELFS